MIFVDSNMWCYYFDQRLPEHVKVRDPLREIIKSEEIACNTIVVMEVAHYLARHFTEKTARKKIEYFINLRNIRIADFNQQILTATLDILLAHAHSDGLGGRDATIVATLNSQSIKRVFSHDNIFQRLATKLDLEVIDPIRPT